MSKIFIIILLSFSLLEAKITLSPQAESILNNINNKNSEFYSAARILKDAEIEALVNEIKNSNLTTEEKLYLSIESYSLWSSISVLSGNARESYKMLLDVHNNTKKDKLFKNADSDIYSAFSDFSASLINLASVNNQLPYTIVIDMNNYARLAMLKNPNDARAKQLIAIWQIYTMGYYNNYNFSAVIDFFEDYDSLPEYMVYRMHIYKSVAYIKSNKVKDAFAELELAKQIYPDGLYTFLLENGYRNGREFFYYTK